jgi:hypothetical protein
VEMPVEVEAQRRAGRMTYPDLSRRPSFLYILVLAGIGWYMRKCAMFTRANRRRYFAMIPQHNVSTTHMTGEACNFTAKWTPEVPAYHLDLYCSPSYPDCVHYPPQTRPEVLRSQIPMIACRSIDRDFCFRGLFEADADRATGRFY